MRHWIPRSQFARTEALPANFFIRTFCAIYPDGLLLFAIACSLLNGSWWSALNVWLVMVVCVIDCVSCHKSCKSMQLLHANVLVELFASCPCSFVVTSFLVSRNCGNKENWLFVFAYSSRWFLWFGYTSQWGWMIVGLNSSWKSCHLVNKANSRRWCGVIWR